MMPNVLPTYKQLTMWLQRRTLPHGARRIVKASAAIASDIGNIREENQDRVAVARGRNRDGEEYILVTVADGIGGMQAGNICAATAVGAFISAIDGASQLPDGNSQDSGAWLQQAAHTANDTVFSLFRASGGSTLAAVLLRPNAPAYWLSVGDSRVYTLNREKLEQISVDDTIAGQLGQDSEEHSERSRLLQFIGMGSDLEPNIGAIANDAADTLILTTDGVHYLASAPEWLTNIVRHAPDSGVCVKRLVDLSRWCGGLDNATVAVITLPLQTPCENWPPYHCLEVWDPYGELQIVGMVTSTDSAPSPEPTDSTIPTAAEHGAKPSAAASDKKIQSDALAVEKAKPRRKRVARKSKELGDTNGGHEAAGKRASERPRLDIEFPSNSGKDEQNS